MSDLKKGLCDCKFARVVFFPATWVSLVRHHSLHALCFIYSMCAVICLFMYLFCHGACPPPSPPLTSSLFQELSNQVNFSLKQLLKYVLHKHCLSVNITNLMSTSEKMKETKDHVGLYLKKEGWCCRGSWGF